MKWDSGQEYTRYRIRQFWLRLRLLTFRASSSSSNGHMSLPGYL